MEIKSSATIGKKRKHTLIIGKPKKGKTHMLGTVADHENLFVIDSENGLETISNKEFDFVEAKDYDQFKEGIKTFFEQKDKRGYTALGIDSITRVQTYLTASILKKNDRKKANYDDYNEILASMRKLIDGLTKADDFSLVCLAHEEDKDDSKNTSNWPLLDGAFKFEICGYFDTVVVCDDGLDSKGKKVNFARLSGNGKCVAGTRLQHLKGTDKIPNDYGYLLTNKQGE